MDKYNPSPLHGEREECQRRGALLWEPPRRRRSVNVSALSSPLSLSLSLSLSPAATKSEDQYIDRPIPLERCLVFAADTFTFRILHSLYIKKREGEKEREREGRKEKKRERGEKRGERVRKNKERILL